MIPQTWPGRPGTGEVALAHAVPLREFVSLADTG